MDPPTLQSDFCRSNAQLVAQAACSGLITVIPPGGTLMSVWLITPSGLDFLFDPF
jgi:hypothetical protein